MTDNTEGLGMGMYRIELAARLSDGKVYHAGREGFLSDALGADATKMRLTEVIDLWLAQLVEIRSIIGAVTA